MHLRFHRRVHGRDRRRLRGGWGRSSSRELLERRLGAGSHLLRVHRDAGSHHRRDGRGRLDAGSRLRAVRQLPDAVRLDEVNRGEVPAGEECCSGSGLGAGPFPVHSRTGCYPVEVLPGAGPFPVRSRTGCYPVEVRRDGDRLVTRASQWKRALPHPLRVPLQPARQRPVLQRQAPLVRPELLGWVLLQASRQVPEQEQELPQRASRREPEQELVPEPGVNQAWLPTSLPFWPRVPFHRQRQA